MSFRFSAGDIVLIGQLAYRLCNTLKQDHRPACRELGNALFGRRCALDHLSRRAKEFPIPLEIGGDNAKRMRDDLDTLITSCATTLLDLERIFAKYNEGLEAGDQTGQLQPTDRLRAKKKALIVTSKKNAKLNCMKVRWSSDHRTLLDFRVKL